MNQINYQREKIKLSNHTPSSKKFRVARTLWAGLFPLYLMEYLKILPPAFEIVDIDEYDETLSLLEAGQIDGNFNSLADALLLINKGIDLRLVMISDLSVGVDGVLARKEISTIDMLRGKRIGVSKHTYSHIFVEQVLRRHGLSESSVNYINIRGEQVPKALHEGMIDAGHTWGIHIDEGKNLGANYLFSSIEFPGLMLDALFVRYDALEGHASEWESFSRAHDQALEWWMENHDSGIDVISAMTMIANQDLKNMLIGVDFISQGQALDLIKKDGTAPPNLYASCKLFNEFFINHGVYNTPIELDQVIKMM